MPACLSDLAGNDIVGLLVLTDVLEPVDVDVVEARREDTEELDEDEDEEEDDEEVY